MGRRCLGHRGWSESRPQTLQLFSGTVTLPRMNRLARLFRSTPQAVQPNPSYDFHAYRRLQVVGESKYQDELRFLCGSEPGEVVEQERIAEMVPEPDNRFDPNAVAIYIDGYKVGYLSREDAANWSPYLRDLQAQDVPTICRAYAGCIGKENGNPNIGVSLTLPLQ